MSDEMHKLAHSWNDAWNSRDADQLLAFLTSDATYYEPDAEGGPVAAAQGLRDAAEKTWRDWPNATFEVVSVVAEAPRIAVEWRSSATHQSGKVLTLEGIDLLECEGARFKSVKVYYDTHVRRTLG